jgi:hypothetical protein
VKAFDLPWVHPYDVTALGRGRYLVECIYALRGFHHDLIVEMKP